MTLSTEGSTRNPKGFSLEPKTVFPETKKSPMGVLYTLRLVFGGMVRNVVNRTQAVEITQ